MLFNSYEFICLFVPITALLFFGLGKIGGRSWAITSLTIASLFFYGWWNPRYLGLILLSIIVNYQIGSILGNDDIKESKRRLTFAIGLILNIGSIAYFKYAGFFVESINSITHQNWLIPEIVLPLGISFFTFQQVSYLADAFHHQTQRYNFVDYTLFVCFFPQLIAGPIILHEEVMPQFEEKETYKFRWDNLSIGVAIFTMGLAKKVLLADSISTFADPVFAAVLDGKTLSFWEAWCGALAYTFQLYFDFSGYSDMAIGGARIFGIKLPLNFNSPYKALNISDFWRRWHITLSRFLRDYIYIPLGGSRCSSTRQAINLLITMLLGGLWHGAGWAFVIWGGIHGLYLVIHRQWQLFWEKIRGKGFKLHPIEAWFWRIVTFFFVVIAWVLFRAEKIAPAWSMLQSMFGLNGISLPSIAGKTLPWLSTFGIRFEGILAGSQTALPSIWAILGLIIVTSIAWFTPNAVQVASIFDPALDYEQAQAKDPNLPIAWLCWQPNLVWSILIGCMGGASLALISRPSAFLYFQF